MEIPTCMNHSHSSGKCVKNGLWKRGSGIQHSQNRRLYCRFDVETWKDLPALAGAVETWKLLTTQSRQWLN